MDEQAFVAAADAQLEWIGTALDGLCDSGEVEIDVETKPGGVIEIECQDGSRIIVNRHVAAREIWIAAKSGGFHFRFDGAHWVNTRDGEELKIALARVLGQQCGVTLQV